MTIEPTARKVEGYVNQAENHAAMAHLTLDFESLKTAATRFAEAGAAIHARQFSATTGAPALNQALRDAEEALLNPDGLPKRAWYEHTIYAPGEFTGYAAVVIPGVTEAIDAGDSARTQTQIGMLAAALQPVLRNPRARC